MNAQDTFVKLQGELSKLLNSGEVETSAIPDDEFEKRYKRLKAIRDWWGLPWDKIEIEVKSTQYKEEWIWESRRDAAFKKYYGIRLKMDKMETLMK